MNKYDCYGYNKEKPQSIFSTIFNFIGCVMIMIEMIAVIIMIFGGF
jgi:hypothetical protein